MFSISDTTRYDVIIVGGSISGCIAALFYARKNVRVLILEKKKINKYYKLLCTHFIQPVAMSALKRLELADSLINEGALKTKAAFWTKHGWIDPDDSYLPEHNELFSLNIEREYLDPFLRDEVLKNNNITLQLDSNVIGINKVADSWVVDIENADKIIKASSNFVIAADGRNSTMAKLLNNETHLEDNQRSAIFAYFKGIARPDKNKSLFYLLDEGMAFFYPQGNGRSLLCVYLAHDVAIEWRKNNVPEYLLDFFKNLSKIPDLSNAKLDSKVFGYYKYKNQTRNSVCYGVPFIGDAVLSLDPMSGVGCAFAINSAEILFDATIDLFVNDLDVSVGLSKYKVNHANFFTMHANGIKADSFLTSSNSAKLNIYNEIVKSEKLQQAFISLTERLINPQQFQKAFLLEKAKSTENCYA